MPSPRKFYTGVGLDPEVTQYLTELSRHLGRNRSWLINAIVGEHARQTRVDAEARTADFMSRELPVIQF